MRQALGKDGKIRIDTNWSANQATVAIQQLESAAQGLEYVEQPCISIAELAEVRHKTGIKIVADESLRLAPKPMDVDLSQAADIAIIKCTPLGGIASSIRIANHLNIPCVVSSALETSIDLWSQLQRAANIPALQYACGLDTLFLMQGDLVATLMRFTLPPRHDHCPPTPIRTQPRTTPSVPHA